MLLQKCNLIKLPKIPDARGSLSFIENHLHIPFAIQRVYYLYNIPNGVQRGGHAHKALQQLIIAISGSFDVLLDDGSNKNTFTLNSADQGLYVCPMIWRELDNFSADAVCLVLASAPYDEQDYFRDYEEFLKAARGVGA